MRRCIFFAVFANIIFGSQCRYTDFLKPCPINDGECQRQLFQNAMPHYAQGVPELNMPPIDPLQLKNVTTSVPGLIDITLIDGAAKGIKDCIFEKMSTDIEKEYATMEVRCNVTIKGHFKAGASGAGLPFYLGNDTIHADGHAKVDIDNVRIKLEYNFSPVKDEDGEIRLKCKKGHFDYTYDFGDRVSFKANNIYVGKQDISEMVVEFLNQNWRLALNLVGKPFMNAIMDVVQDFEFKFFTNTPARYFISDDLEKYIHDD